MPAAPRDQRPKQVKIGTFTVKITWAPTLFMVDEELLNGVSFPEQLAIIVRTDVAPNVERATLLHELLHMALSLGGAHLSSGGMKRGYVEEHVVRVLEGPLLGLLRDNPQLVRYLTEK